LALHPKNHSRRGERDDKRRTSFTSIHCHHRRPSRPYPAFAVKPGSDLFALYRWKPERQQIIVGVADAARSNLPQGSASATKSYAGS
jgi:hypothetical protein